MISYPRRMATLLRSSVARTCLRASWAGRATCRVLLDLRHAPFSHGHAYVAVSRVHVAADCGAFIDDSCCVERRGGRCAVMGSVVYDELLRSPSAATTAAPPADTGTVRRKRIGDFIEQLDDRTTAKLTRRCMSAAKSRKRKRSDRVDALALLTASSCVEQ